MKVSGREINILIRKIEKAREEEFASSVMYCIASKKIIQKRE